MSTTSKTERQPEPHAGQSASRCPACQAELDAKATPLHSIVLCARCCAVLLWDGAYSLVTADEIDALSERNRARLHALAARQRARLASRGLLN